MARVAFFALYFLTPSVPASLYMRYAGGGAGTYSLSMLFGVVAFVLACNQFILATRPGLAVKALGLQGLLAFHGAMALAILALAVAHRFLKAAAGFTLDTPQAAAGLSALILFALASAVALLLLAKPLAAAFARLRSWAALRLGLGYKAARAVHNLTVLAALALMVHVPLASSSALAANPWGVGWLAAWMVMSLGLYARYRLRGRTVRAS